MTRSEPETETWWRKPGPVEAKQFKGFGPGGNGEATLVWLHSLNVQADPLRGEIEIDTGTDDLRIRAKAGDWFVVGVDGGVYRVKKHMWHELYQKRPTS